MATRGSLVATFLVARIGALLFAATASHIPTETRQENPPSPIRETRAVVLPECKPRELRKPGDPIRVNTVKAAPKLVDVRASYQGVATGVVVVEFEVAPDGTVRAARVLRSVPPCDEAALRAIQEWRFGQTCLDGVPVPTMRVGAVPCGDTEEGSSVSIPPRIVTVAPIYPEAAVAARMQGRVVLSVAVAIDGSVAQVEVVKSVPSLDQAAIDAVRQWRYRPTYRDGVPQSIVVRETLVFELDGSR